MILRVIRFMFMFQCKLDFFLGDDGLTFVQESGLWTEAVMFSSAQQIRYEKAELNCEMFIKTCMQTFHDTMFEMFPAKCRQKVDFNFTIVFGS